jgi:hypothetical protein
MTNWIVGICVLMTLLRPFDKQLRSPVPERPVSTWIVNWFGPDHFVTQRSIVAQQLEQVPGAQLAIVRYSPDHDPIDEWVYNAADVDSSRIVWARAMDPADDLELIRYYNQRRAWLIQPDSRSEQIVPYPLPQQVTAVSLH